MTSASRADPACDVGRAERHRPRTVPCAGDGDHRRITSDDPGGEGPKAGRRTRRASGHHRRQPRRRPHAAADLGLKVRVARVVAEEPVGTIVGQSPSAGAEVREGATVTLRVSTGPSEITVPDVIGLDEESARLELENAGFEVRVIDEPTDDPTRDAATVDQTPRGGSTAREGAVVTITIARFG